MTSPPSITEDFRQSTDTGWELNRLTQNAGTPLVEDSRTNGWSSNIQPPTPTLRRLVAPITGAGAAAMVAVVLGTATALAFGWSEFLVAAVAIGALLVAAAAFLIGRSAYAVDVDLQSTRVVAGERATGALTVRNNGSRRLLPSRMELPVGGSLASFRIPGLAGGAEHEELFVIPTSRRAVIDVGPALSVRGDPLGLLRRQVKWTAVSNLFVHPKTIALHGAATGSVKDLDGQPTKDLSSNDVSFHALRQYVPGDDRRYVHWRTSARTGTLMVRQFEETRRTHLAVALSVDPNEYATIEEFELAISVAASLGVQAMREQRPVTIGAGARTVRGRTARTLLDGFAGLDARPGAGILPAGRYTAAAVPNASVGMLITGPQCSAITIRRASLGFPVGVRVLAIRTQAGSPVRLGLIDRVDVATIGSLKDLPAALRRMRAA